MLDGIIQENYPKNKIKAFDYQWLLVSATGSRYRNYAFTGFKNFIIVGLKKSELTANDIHSPLLLIKNRQPTSEWQTHLSVQSWLFNNRRNQKVFFHSHPTDWIIISNSKKYKEDKSALEKSIRDCLPELNFYFPGEIKLLPYELPGSKELAKITLDALDNSNVLIWERHGIVIIAENINQAFDYMEIISKAAAVYLALKL